jgi:diguanylate cyclase (GGDEF)-like protein
VRRTSDVAAWSVWPAYAYLALGLAASAIYFVFPASLRQWLYVAIGLSSVAAIGAGIWRYRPAIATAWYLMALGQFLFSFGDLVWTYYEMIRGIEAPFPSIADVSYLAGYVPLTVGLAMLVRARRPGRDIATALDAAMVGVVAGVASWLFLMEPLVADAGASRLEAAVSAAYPLADVVLIAIVSSLLLAHDRGSTSLRFIVASLVLSVVADTLYIPGGLQGWYSSGHALDLGWLVAYVCWGVAALHPSMRGLTDRSERDDPPRFSQRRLAVQALVVVGLPLAWILMNAENPDADSLVILLGPTLFSILVLTRMGRLRLGIEHAGLHDPLTGLPNRRLLLSRMSEIKRRSNRSRTPFAVFFVDLKGFKSVNDRLGHEAGDAALVEIAERLRHTTRTGDMIARMGGDEFVVVCENIDATQAEALAKRMESSIAAPIDLDGQAVEVVADIGIALDLATDPDRDLSELVAEADRAMYAAKLSG